MSIFEEAQAILIEGLEVLRWRANESRATRSAKESQRAVSSRTWLCFDPTSWQELAADVISAGKCLVFVFVKNVRVQNRLIDSEQRLIEGEADKGKLGSIKRRKIVSCDLLPLHSRLTREWKPHPRRQYKI